MADHRLLITHDQNAIRLSWQRGNAPQRFTDPIPFEHPFDAATLERLRWYLEDYISFPYGIYPDQAVQVEQQFQGWGQQLFERVFHSTDEGRAFYQEATRAGLDRCEIGIASDQPTVLNLPWELLYAPTEQFLAPKLAGMYRTLSSHAVRAPLSQLPTDQLNILLVIARPYQQDVGFQTIAQPMLDALKPLRDQGLINLKVLRPPTFAAFEQELNTHRDGYYHIVHFDGHGTFDPNAQGMQYQFTGETGLGQLVFETAEGKPEVINADRIAQSLQACRVPVFVLNACKSAQEGGEKFSSVAARFVFAGAQGVVAMAYSVYADAAKAFIGRFYGELTRGVCVAEAVAAARLSMLNQPQRQSPRGPRTLQDWLVPVLYQQETYTPLQRQTRAPSFDQLIEQATSAEPTDRAPATVLPEEGTYGFIGRGYDILRLERAFRRSPVVLLKGMGGVGKTELSLGFARWLADTQGRESGTFFTSFERGATLSNVVNDIGRRLGGDKFAALMADLQEAIVLQYLKTNPCLLIWDNFEPIAGFPAGNEPLLPERERERLKGFLKALRQGESWVLMSSRREEPWLDCGYDLMELRGLAQPDAEALAAKILQTAGVDRNTLPSEYLELLTLLNGHPLSLRVVLPNLKHESADNLLAALRNGLDTFAGAEEEGRERSLTVSLDYSFHTLSAQARQHLPFLAFFTERVDANLLSLFSSNADDEFGKAYRAVFGGNPGKDEWLALLQEAAEAGILQHLNSTIYQLHPTLPWYLRRAMPAATAPLEGQLLRFYALLAENYRQRLVDKADLARFLLTVEEPNLLRFLRLAEQQQAWAEAQALLQALGDLYERTSRKAEFGSLRQRALQQVGLHLEEVKPKGQDALSLWMYIRGSEANDALQRADLEGARAIHQEILDELTALNDSQLDGNIAVANHQLGMVAQGQRHFDEAIAYYQKALQIFEAAGDAHNAAADYHQLGVVAQRQRRFDDATAYYQKALQIFEAAGDAYKAASNYQGLGNVAYLQRRFDEAIAYYQKALQIFEAAGDAYKAADEYHQLGVVAQEQRRFDEATAYYQKALQIFEAAGDAHSAAAYHQLGTVAQEQRHFDEANAYYQKALQIFEAAGDVHNAADEYHQLGIVAQEQRHFDEATAYYQKALQIYEAAGDAYQAANTLAMLAILSQAQQDFGNATAYAAKAVYAFIQATDERKAMGMVNLLRQVLNEVGNTQFQTLWQAATGEACPDDLFNLIQQSSQPNE